MKKNIIEDEFELVAAIQKCISFIKKTWKYLMISSIAGIAMGLFIHYLTPPYYISQLGFYSENLSDRKLYSLILDMEKFLKNQEFAQLSDKMKIGEGSIKKILSMKVSAVEEEIGEVNSSDVKENGILVTFKVSDKNLFDSLEIGVKNYVEGTDYVRSRLDLYRSSLKYNIEKLDKEIKDLDSLKVKLSYTITKGGKSNLFISDIGNTGAKLVEFYEKRSNLQNQLELISDVRVFKNFSKYNKKAGPRMIYTLLANISISLSIGLLVYFYPSLRKFVIEA
jgi:hypothetical protein